MAIDSKSVDSVEGKGHVSYLIEHVFWEGMESYFLKARNAAINEKVDTNSFVVLAKHLAVLESVDSLQGTHQRTNPMVTY